MEASNLSTLPGPIFNMTIQVDVSRRAFLRGTFSLGTALTLEFVEPALAISSCFLTPKETEGPFFPVTFPLDKDNDLTQLEGSTKNADGQMIVVRGVVQDELCRPAPGAMVEIWQACTTGRYNHPRDRNPAKVDPHFQYWGRTVANERGEYGFKTIKPGSYPVNWFWTRPPHIHFKVYSRHHHMLTTQMYFSGDPLNEKDRLLGEHPDQDQEKFIVSFAEFRGIPTGHFDLTLKTRQR